MTITQALCQSCGACCSLIIDGELVACRYLQAESGTFACAIYGSRPAVCREYDCTREAINPLVKERVAKALHATLLADAA